MNSMFAQQQQPQIQTFNPEAVAQQFTGWTYNLGQPYDAIVPQIAKYVINEIQNTALQTKHPIRIGAFNILSQNAFNNNDFNFLLKVIMHRIAHGAVNHEFASLNEVASAVIPRVTKACACGLAVTDTEFLQQLQPADASDARVQAESWGYFCNLANNQAQFIPFNQYAAANQFQSVNSATANALEAAKSLAGATAGAFHGSGDYIPTTPGGNNGGLTQGKYGRKHEAIQGVLQGSMQKAILEVQAASPTNTSNIGMRYAKGSIESFDSDVTDFTKSLGAETVTYTPVAPVEPTPPPPALFTLTVNGREIEAIREIGPSDTRKWVPSEIQRFHPTQCVRTHYPRYFETSIGSIFAVMQPLDEQQKELTMDYDTHAIDPTKGQPDAAAPKAPIREEAKVLYADKKDIKLKIKVYDVKTIEEDLSSCVRNVLLTAGLSDDVQDAHVKKSIINTPILYNDYTNAEDDVVVVRAMAKATDFKAAAALLKQVHSSQLKGLLDAQLVQAINTMCKVEMAIPVTINSFINDSPDLIAAIEAAPSLGSYYAGIITKHQATILMNNIIIVPALEMKEHALATLTLSDDIQLTDEKLKTILFLQRNVSVAWMNYTDDELALALPAIGPGHLQESHYPALYAIVKEVFKNISDKERITEVRLVTTDNVSYNLHRSLVGPEVFLITKSDKPL